MSEEPKIRIKRVLMDELGLTEAEVTGDGSLNGNLSADDRQLAMVELTIRLEEEFSIAIPDEDMDQLKTLRDLYEYLFRRVDIG